MLAICRTKAAKGGVTPVLHHQLMQELALDRRYRTLYIPAGSFQILAEHGEAFEALQRFREHLEPGGELVVTLAVPWPCFAAERQWRLRRSGVRPIDGASVLVYEAMSCDCVEQLQHIWLRYEVFKEGTPVQSQLRMHQLRWYYKHEIVMMLESVGFREIRVQCGYHDAFGFHALRRKSYTTAQVAVTSAVRIPSWRFASPGTRPQDRPANTTERT